MCFGRVSNNVSDSDHILCDRITTNPTHYTGPATAAQLPSKCNDVLRRFWKYSVCTQVLLCARCYDIASEVEKRTVTLNQKNPDQRRLIGWPPPGTGEALTPLHRKVVAAWCRIWSVKSRFYLDQKWVCEHFCWISQNMQYRVYT